MYAIWYLEMNRKEVLVDRSDIEVCVYWRKAIKFFGKGLHVFIESTAKVFIILI